MKFSLEDIHTKHQDWLANMEKKKNELRNTCCIMDNEKYITYVLALLPQEEYQTTILVLLKDKLRRATLIIQEAKIFWMINSKPCKS